MYTRNTKHASSKHSEPIQIHQLITACEK